MPYSLYLQLMSSATFQCNYFADDRDLLNLPEARGGEPIMADTWGQQGSSSL